jgi:hypothetical protein
MMERTGETHIRHKGNTEDTVGEDEAEAAEADKEDSMDIS